MDEADASWLQGARTMFRKPNQAKSRSTLLDFSGGASAHPAVGGFFSAAGQSSDPQLAEVFEGVGVIGTVANDASRLRHQPIFHATTRVTSWGVALSVTDGERQTSAVCHCQELRTCAPLGLAHTSVPFWRR